MAKGEPGGKGDSLRKGANQKLFGKNYDEIKWQKVCKRHLVARDEDGRCPRCWDAALKQQEEWSEQK